MNSNLLKQASKAINSDFGKPAISAVKRAAESDLGQALKEKAVSEVKRKVLEGTNKALDSIPLVKEVVQSDLGQELQKKLYSEVAPLAE